MATGNFLYSVAGSVVSVQSLIGGISGIAHLNHPILLIVTIPMKSVVLHIAVFVEGVLGIVAVACRQGRWSDSQNVVSVYVNSCLGRKTAAVLVQPVAEAIVVPRNRPRRSTTRHGGFNSRPCVV